MDGYPPAASGHLELVQNCRWSLPTLPTTSTSHSYVMILCETSRDVLRNTRISVPRRILKSDFENVKQKIHCSRRALLAEQRQHLDVVRCMVWVVWLGPTMSLVWFSVRFDQLARLCCPFLFRPVADCPCA